MDTLCKKYQKTLSKTYINGSHSPDIEERLIFPSHCAQRNFIYDKHKNYSHGFYFDEVNPNADKATEMKIQYQTPAVSTLKDRDIGIRKRMMEKYFWRQMTRQVIKEIENPNEMENYCTEYCSRYKNNSESDVSCLENYQNILKYPLYGTGANAWTIYNMTLTKYDQKNVLHPFRKNCDFSKPLPEKMDVGWII